MTQARAWISAVAVIAVACGHRSAPVAPELIHPKPPANVVATAMPGGVQLRWARPTQYTSGKRMRDLDGFVVERAPDDGRGGVFAEIGTIHLEDRYRFQQTRRVEWLDAAATDGQRYLYRVLALTLDGYRSAPAGPVSIDFHRPAAPPPTTPKSTTGAPQ
jgi:hypothetical protein